MPYIVLRIITSPSVMPLLQKNVMESSLIHPYRTGIVAPAGTHFCKLAVKYEGARNGNDQNRKVHDVEVMLQRSLSATFCH